MKIKGSSKNQVYLGLRFGPNNCWPVLHNIYQASSHSLFIFSPLARALYFKLCQQRQFPLSPRHISITTVTQDCYYGITAA